MKTGNVSQNAMFYTQTKPACEDKTDNKREPNKAIGDKVDLSTKGLSGMSTPIASYGEALELLKGIDFRQFKMADRISIDAKAKLTELLQF
jgi:hypothetical protein